MHKLIIKIIVLLVFSSVEIQAQKENNIWYFGSHAGLDFSNDSVTALGNGALYDNDNSSTVCDANGQLLFYTNSDTVWNRFHQIMLNGTGLAGSITSGQCGLIVPQPGTLKYFIFTNAQFSSSIGLNYSKVDMQEDNGLGAVTIKNIQLFPYSSEKLDAIYNPADDSYWVVTHPFDSDRFYVYKITSAGLDTTPVISEPCAMYTGGSPAGYNAIGQMTISPDGNTIASGVFSDGFIELCDFNMSTGLVTHSRIIPDFPNPWGIAFSPGSKMLYAVPWWTDNVVQFNLTDTAISAICASKTTIGHATASNQYHYQAGYMQLGPDQRLYITRYQTHYLAVVNFPDIYGLECGFVNDGVFLGTKFSTSGLSRVPVRPSVPGYTPPLRLSAETLFTYPNPSQGVFKVCSSRIPEGTMVTISMTDIQGRIVLTEHQPYLKGDTFYCKGLCAGIYFLNLQCNDFNFTCRVNICN